MTDELMFGKKYHVETMGCQMNAHDSEKISGLLRGLGMNATEIESDADIIIINTCCVRENAENKVFGHIGNIKKLKETRQKDGKETMLIVCGCMTQQQHVIETIRAKYRFVDIVIGTFNIHKLPELITRRLSSRDQIIDVWESHDDTDFEDLPAVREFSFKSGVNVMYGCDNFCSYCVVPYVRGRERSAAPETVVEHVEELVADGVVEVMLLGQNVNKYGKGLDTPITFAELLTRVAAVKGLERIRFMTSHPRDLTDDVLDVMAREPKVCKHLHLPVQSGSNKILKSMNRGYTREHFLGIIERARKIVPNISITTDLIVGLPGETEEDFEDTLSLCREARFTSAFTFQYSKRVGTKAAAMPEQVPQEVVTERFGRLIETLTPAALEHQREMVGTTQLVLAERFKPTDNGALEGRTDDNTLVQFEGQRCDVGKLFTVIIDSEKPTCLFGHKA